MGRLPYLIAAGLVAVVAAAPAQGQAAGMQAEFAAPFERASQIIVQGRIWSCSGTTCTTRGDDPRPAIACRRLARKAGPVTRFATSEAELDAAGLASCNDRK